MGSVKLAGVGRSEHRQVNRAVKFSLNACKNILVVILMMDCPFCETVLCALYLEWGNLRCCMLCGGRSRKKICCKLQLKFKSRVTS